MRFSRRDLEHLLAQGRFEEALTALLLLRAEAPDNESASRAIVHLKQRLLTEYLAQLGDLDARPTFTGAVDSSEERLVARLLDGETSLETVLERSTLGKLSTARLLVRWRTNGALRSAGLQARPLDVRSQLDVRAMPTPPTLRDSTLDLPPSPASAPHPAPPAPLPAPPQGEGVEALLDEASEACLSRRFDRALAIYERCAALAPTHPRVVHNLARLRQLTTASRTR